MILLPVYICIGLLLGPSGISIETPAYFPLIFKWCAAGFLLNAGLECSFTVMREHFKKISIISVGAFLPAFIVGFLVAPWLGVDSSVGRWVVATALSVSALPVIVQILKGARLLNSPTGQIVIAAASLCDLVAWICFLAVLPSTHQSSWIQSHFPVLFFFAGIAANLFASGALIKWKEIIASLSKFIFAPLFFISIGLQINLWDSFDIGLIVATFLVATAVKIFGLQLFARMAKVSAQDSWIIAVALNARGAMEILLAILAYQSGLIDKHWLTNLTVVAVATSLIANPIIAYLQKTAKRTHQ